MSAEPGTLGWLLEHTTVMCALCDACHHSAMLDTVMLIRRFGADHSYLNWKPPGLVCTQCGSRCISVQIQYGNLPPVPGR